MPIRKLIPTVPNAILVMGGRWPEKKVVVTVDQAPYVSPAIFSRFSALWAEDALANSRKVADDPGVGIIMPPQIEGDVLHFSMHLATYLQGMAHEAQNNLGHPNPDVAQAAADVVEAYRLGAAMPNRPQCAACLVTSDGKTLLVQRSAATAVASGKMHTSVVGGIHPKKGDLTGGAAVPLFVALRRQAYEELGLASSEITSCELAAVATDQDRLSQPILAMVMRTSLSGEELLGTIEARAADKWEADRYLLRDLTPALWNEVLALDMPAIGKICIASAIENAYFN